MSDTPPTNPARADERPAVIVDVDAVTVHRPSGVLPPPVWAPLRPHRDVVTVIEAFRASGHALIYLAASWKHTQRAVGEQWIGQYLPVPYAALLMRTGRDGRHTGDLKSHLYTTFVRDRWRVTCVIDHREQDVPMWQRHGLTCLWVTQGTPSSARGDAARGP